MKATARARCRLHGHHTWKGTWRNLERDIVRQLLTAQAYAPSGTSFKRKISAFLRPEIQSLLLHRLSHYLHVSGWVRLGRALCRANYVLHKVNISPQSCIGPACRLPHPAGTFFHGQAGCELTLFSLSICCNAQGRLEGPVADGPNLGDRVLVGAHAVLLGPLEVGNDTKIPYSIRLHHDAPAGAIVMSKNLLLTYHKPSSDAQDESSCMPRGL